MIKRTYRPLLIATVGLLLAGIAGLGFIFSSSAQPPEWSLTKLEAEAAQGAVAHVVITGTTAETTDSQGHIWETQLPTDSAPVADKLADLFSQLRPGHSGHLDVGDDQVEALAALVEA